MLEQIPSSPTESVSPAAAAKAKSGKQGVFTNLFKALEGKGIANGKSAAAALAQAHSKGIDLKGSAKTGVAGITAKGLKTHSDTEGEEAAGKKLIKGTGADLNPQLNPQAVALEAVNRSNSAHIGKASAGELQEEGEQDALFQASKRQADKGGKQHSGENSQASAINTADQKHNVQAGKHVLNQGSNQAESNHNNSDRIGSNRIATGQNNSTQDSSKLNESNPQIGIAQVRAAGADEAANKASIDTGTAGRAADKNIVSGQATKNQASTEAEAALLAGNAQARRAAAQPSAKAASGESSSGKPVNQAGAIDNETLQHDADAVQRVREELAGMVHKTAAKAAQAGYNTKGRSSDAQLTAQAGVAHTQSSNPVAQPVNTQAIAGGQANALAAAVAAETGQQSGQDTGSRQEPTDSRLMAAQATDNKPQQAFDLQQQNATRMAQPMRPLEAMQSIAHSAANGSTRLELQLEPAHLGKIHISLQTDAAKQLQMHLTVESTVTRQVIEQHMPQLRAALEQQGLNLDNFSLHTGSHNQQQQHAFEHAARPGAGNDQYPLSGGMESAATNQPAFASSRLSIHI